VLGEQQSAVHGVGEHDLLAPRLVEGEAALVVLVLAALDTAIEPAEEHLDGAVRARLLEQAAQRDAGPLRGPDGLQQPRLAERAGGEQRAAVACALERDGARDGGPRAQVVERQRELAAAADLQAPRRRIDDRDVVVDQQVVQPGGRDVVGECLEREAVVARGEAKLGGGDLVRVGDERGRVG
jgi:hypothetical protein